MEWCCEMDFIWDIHKSSKHSSFIYIQVPKHDTLVSLVKISVTYRLEFMQTLRRWFVNKKKVTKYKKIVVVNIFWELTTCSSRCDFKSDIWYLCKISALYFEDKLKTNLITRIFESGQVVLRRSGQLEMTSRWQIQHHLIS